MRFSGGEAPASLDLPRWLRVESGPLGVAEGRAAYATTSDGAPTADVESISMHHIAEIGRSLWPRSPYYRAPGATLDEKYQSMAEEPNPRLKDWIFDAKNRI